MLRVKQTTPKATLPCWQENVGGLCIFAGETNIISEHTMGTLDTGISIIVPPGYQALIRSCRELAEKYCIMAAPVGINAKEDWHSLNVALYNASSRIYKVEVGQLIAELVLIPTIHPVLSVAVN